MKEAEFMCVVDFVDTMYVCTHSVGRIIVRISQNMARNTEALVVAVCMMFLNNLYECVSI